MFGFSKEVELKKKILFYLDEQSNCVTTDEITEYLGELTNQTVIKYLKEIDQDIRLLYMPSALFLEIRVSCGIQLHRNNASLHDLLENLYRQDLTYHIYRKLFLKRQFPTAEFCEKYQVSLSTARRLVKKMNQELEPYEIYIRIGRKISIRGEESRIRVLFFILFYGIHRKIATISWIDKQQYLLKGKEICEKFYETPDEERLEVFALWLAINHHSDQRGFSIQSDLLEESYAPMLLSDNLFCPNTFNYLLLMAYSLEIFDFKPMLSFGEIHRNPYSIGVSSWLEIIEKNLRKLSKEEKEYWYLTFYKYGLMKKVLGTSEALKENIQRINRKKRQKNTYFHRVYEQLWWAFSSGNPELVGTIDKEILRELTYQMMSDEEMIPILRCCWHSSLPVRVLQKMEKVLRLELRNRANLVFTDQKERVDINISTESADKGVLVMYPLTQQDFRQMEKEIERCIGQISESDSLENSFEINRLYYQIG